VWVWYVAAVCVLLAAGVACCADDRVLRYTTQYGSEEVGGEFGS